MDELNDINLPHDADDLSKHAPALFELKGTQEGFIVPVQRTPYGENYFEDFTDRVVSMTFIPEDGGLVVPENYFEELSGIIEAKTSFDGVYTERSRSAQDDKDHTAGLIVPENYFEELSSIIEAKSIIPTDSGLTEPQNYFEELPSLIDAKASFDSAQDDKNHTAGLIVPENYFEDLHSNIESKIALESALPKTEGEVPADYFSRMESELHVHIALDNVKQDEGFAVPEGYFNNLTERILSETVIDKDAINDDQVPSGYFEELPGKVIARLEAEGEINEESGRIIVFAEWSKKNWRQISVAASVALLIGISWFFLTNTENNPGNVIAFNPDKIVPDRIIHSVPQNENMIRREEQLTGIAAQIPNNGEEIKLTSNQEVIMNEEEIIAQADVMDESMLMDFVAENNVIESTGESLDADMMEYLMNENTGLEDFDPADIKKP